jgi:hypothetical protein
VQSNEPAAQPRQGIRGVGVHRANWHRPRRPRREQGCGRDSKRTCKPTPDTRRTSRLWRAGGTSGSCSRSYVATRLGTARHRLDRTPIPWSLVRPKHGPSRRPRKALTLLGGVDSGARAILGWPLFCFEVSCRAAVLGRAPQTLPCAFGTATTRRPLGPCPRRPSRWTRHESSTAGPRARLTAAVSAFRIAGSVDQLQRRQRRPVRRRESPDWTAPASLRADPRRRRRSQPELPGPIRRRPLLHHHRRHQRVHAHRAAVRESGHDRAALGLPLSPSTCCDVDRPHVPHHRSPIHPRILTQHPRSGRGGCRRRFAEMGNLFARYVAGAQWLVGSTSAPLPVKGMSSRRCHGLRDPCADRRQRL